MGDVTEVVWVSLEQIYSSLQGPGTLASAKETKDMGVREEVLIKRVMSRSFEQGFRIPASDVVGGPKLRSATLVGFQPPSAPSFAGGPCSEQGFPELAGLAIGYNVEMDRANTGVDAGHFNVVRDPLSLADWHYTDYEVLDGTRLYKKAETYM